MINVLFLIIAEAGRGAYKTVINILGFLLCMHVGA